MIYAQTFEINNINVILFVIEMNVFNHPITTSSVVLFCFIDCVITPTLQTPLHFYLYYIALIPLIFASLSVLVA